MFRGFMFGERGSSLEIWCAAEGRILMVKLMQKVPHLRQKNPAGSK
jgi:hypothetical protein